MKKPFFLLLWLFPFCTLCYDAETEIRRRTNRYREMCHKFKDPRRPEFETLFNAPKLESNRLTKNLPAKLMVCAPPKVGSTSWSSLMRKLLGQDFKTYGKKAVNEMKKNGNFNAEAVKVMIVRHPMERVLSSYLFIFLDSSVHRDLTRKLLTGWFHQPGAVQPGDGERVLDAGDQQTLTFRQFVNFLTQCPKASAECKVATSEGVAQHWIPYWKWCQPCKEGLQYDYVLDLSHIVEDKEFLFKQIPALNDSVPLQLSNPTKRASASTMEAKAKYFGQLTKREIVDLYEKYRLDHQLFGYTPDEYIALGK